MTIGKRVVITGTPSRAAQGVLVNASQLLAGSDDAAQIMQALIGYRGTTAAALQAMIDRGAGFDAAFARGAEMAAERTAGPR